MVSASLKWMYGCIGAICLWLYISYKYNIYAQRGPTHISEFSDHPNTTTSNLKLKVILEWTLPDTEPFVFLGRGQDGFTKRQCKFTNCYVTPDRGYLSQLTDYDVILFHGPEIRNIPNTKFPAVRSPHQKYVFVSMESSHYYPICSKQMDAFYNWTWSYRLDSDSAWGYILVKDELGNVIGPRKVMHWMKLEDMKPVGDKFRAKIATKTKAAAWFVSNCNDLSGRMKFSKLLRTELEKFNLQIDVYGGCGTMKCPLDDRSKCERIIEESYYFYLAFENSFAEDYVTEKLLLALKNNAIPIVYGGANYTRFMPDGIYLNARELGAEKLAAKMNELINNPDQYAEYFSWQNHYSFHSRSESPEYNDYCEFCAVLNDEAKMREVTIVNNFQEWWNSPSYC